VRRRRRLLWHYQGGFHWREGGHCSILGASVAWRRGSMVLPRRQLVERGWVFRSQTALTSDVPAAVTLSWRAAARFLRSPLQPIVDALSTALYPASCALCKQSLLRFAFLPICESCWSAVMPQTGVLCTHCGEDLGLPQSSLAHLAADEPRLCDVCHEQPEGFSRAVAYGRYENELRGLIHLLKYAGMKPIAKRLGQRLAGVVAELPIDAGTEMSVVPVPLYRVKRRQRGFNHAERIASAMVDELRRRDKAHRWAMARAVLRRQRATDSQSRLSPQGRRRNLRGAFAVRDASRIRGRSVLLVDDIYTTGATAAACSRVLLRAGAKEVWVATVARTQREGVAMWDGMFTSVGETVGF
jgi:ComF family protein